MDHALMPDYLDDPADILLSFPDIKAKTTQTLYQGGAVDKSPKGSVDEHIRPLVDLINRHPSFSTLSSCSGRISLFQPWGEEEVSGEQTRGTPESGKGRGCWLLVSHEVIEPSKLLNVFKETSNETEQSAADQDDEKILAYKVEPMLLHVAAATHERGRQLLGLALELGFRESGLVIPSKNSNARVTVAIRGMGLALTVPLAFQGALRPSEEYLRSLAEQSNQRLERNQVKLQRLFRSVQQTLFRPSGGGLERCEPLPNLNLWGHDAVLLLASTAHSSDVDILVFGGYGEGPMSADAEENWKRHCQRLGNIYCLQRRGGHWGTKWIKIPQPTVLSSQETVWMESLGVEGRATTLTPREGLAVFFLGKVQGCNSTTNSIVGIWGGRKGPHHALDELLLYDHSEHQLIAPTDIRGELPSARWGHSLTGLKHSSNDKNSIRRLALLLGGRNEREALNSAHVLSLVPAEGPDASAHFLWETISFSPDLLQSSLPFHHATAAIPDGDSIAVFVLGGQVNPCNLLGAFSADETPEASYESNARTGGHFFSSFSLSINSHNGWIAQSCNMTNNAANSNLTFHFGGAVTVLDGFAATENCHWMLWSGGAPGDQEGANESALPLRLIKFQRTCPAESAEKEWIVDSREIAGLEESVMIHHRALAVPSAGAPNNVEVLLLGGGVMGFAFGPCFSRCYRLNMCRLVDRKSNACLPPSNSVSSQPITGKKKGAPPDAKALETNVVYVRKGDAKLVKTELEKSSYLDKRFRMNPVATPEEDGKEIAVPITDECLKFLNNDQALRSDEYTSWASLVQGAGREEMPFSTSQFARKKKQTKS